MRVIEGLRRAPAIMRANANYRWFIISRMLTRVGQIAEPFYMIYAIEALGLPAGVANDGNGISSNTYLLEIVPEDERPTYIGLANTTLGVVTFLPVLGGWLVANAGYSGTFGIGATFALLGLTASVQLREARLLVVRAQRVTSDA